MKSLFRPELGTDKPDQKVAEWFKRLATNLLPDNDAAFKAGKS